MADDATAQWVALGRQKYVSLTTFRRNGELVSSAVWIARSGDELMVTTFVDTGKVKRLRRDERVELRPCDRRGRVAAGVGAASGVGQVCTDDAARARMSRAFRRKYPVFGTLAFVVTGLSRKAKGRRVVLSIRPVPAP